MPKTSIWRSRVHTDMLIGRIVQMSQIGIDRIPCAQVRCQLNEFNIYLKKYFARSFDYWALDKKLLGKLGDTVLIKRVEMMQRPTATVGHTVDRVIFQYGNIIDPVTGKRVIKDEFADEIELRKKLVHDIVETPLDEEALLFDERRAVQVQQLEDKRKEISK